jgi:hypothetical protein
MASTTTNGVVLEVPYAIIRNIRNQRPWTLAVVGRDPRQYAYNQKQLRSFPATIPQASPGIFVYSGDVITFDLQAPANAVDAAGYDLYSVNPSTGVETKAAEVGFDKVWQKQVKVTITSINATTGAITFATAWS